MKRFFMHAVASAAVLAALSFTGCTKVGGENGKIDGQEEEDNALVFEILDVKTSYQSDAFYYSSLDIATIILCGEGYGEKLAYDYYPVPAEGKFIRIDLNIPEGSLKLIPEGKYPMKDIQKTPNDSYKPMTVFQYYTADVFESGTFYRDTDQNITFSGNEDESYVNITASTTVQDGYKVEVFLTDGTTTVKALYEGVLEF